ncbi:hypothetical protein BKA81DRAFT_346256 [Phyllosticta paracitricarpa]|uniref:Uncharacterized protein n=1 Tax=Phyllosticta paracitricarpa TaxID=2016321 RepID=A0ABR1NAW4_9PEZI
MSCQPSTTERMPHAEKGDTVGVEWKFISRQTWWLHPRSYRSLPRLRPGSCHDTRCAEKEEERGHWQNQKKQKTQRLRQIEKTKRRRMKQTEERHATAPAYPTTPQRENLPPHRHSPHPPALSLVRPYPSAHDRRNPRRGGVKPTSNEAKPSKPSCFLPSAPPLAPTLSRTLTPPNETRRKQARQKAKLFYSLRGLFLFRLFHVVRRARFSYAPLPSPVVVFATSQLSSSQILLCGDFLSIVRAHWEKRAME